MDRNRTINKKSFLWQIHKPGLQPIPTVRPPIRSLAAHLRPFCPQHGNQIRAQFLSPQPVNSFHVSVAFLKETSNSEALISRLISVQVDLRSLVLLTEPSAEPNERGSSQIWLAYPFELFANGCSSSEGVEKVTMALPANCLEGLNHPL